MHRESTSLFYFSKKNLPSKFNTGPHVNCAKDTFSLLCVMESPSPDWQKARSLFDSRASHAVIVEQAHVTLAALRKRILREGWSRARTEAREIVERQNLQQKNDQLRSIVLDECLRDAHVVSQNEPRNMSQSMRRQELLSKITSNGETAGGWQGGGNSATIVDIRLLQSATSRPSSLFQPTGPSSTTEQPQHDASEVQSALEGNGDASENGIRSRSDLDH